MGPGVERKQLLSGLDLGEKASATNPPSGQTPRSWCLNAEFGRRPVGLISSFIAVGKIDSEMLSHFSHLKSKERSICIGVSLRILTKPQHVQVLPKLIMRTEKVTWKREQNS